MLYKNCRELPYHNFNEVQVEGDLTYLIKYGSKHTVDELKKHWIDILEEYFVLSDDFSQKKFFRDKAELNYLQLKLSVLKHVEPLLNLDLPEEQQEKINKILKIYRVNNLEQDILGTNDEINLKINRFSLAYNNEKNNNFEELLASFRMNGCQVNRHEITVSEWIALLKQMKKQSSLKNGRKRKFS